jgi:hypothetical protein
MMDFDTLVLACGGKVVLRTYDEVHYEIPAEHRETVRRFIVQLMDTTPFVYVPIRGLSDD